jgi:predicted RNA-binding Zn ribbon-like protein
MVKQAEGRQDEVMESGHATAERQAFRIGLSALGLCLGFANILDNRLSGHPAERLNSYGDLVAWGHRRGVLTEREAEQLAEAAARRPAEAASILYRAIELREALYRIFSAVAGHRSPQPADLTVLNAALADALVALRIAATEDGFAWVWVRGEEMLGRVPRLVALSAADLLTSSELRAVRECAATNCSWLFLDTTRNRRRRWCDMRVCGNRAKARRHYERKRKPAAAPAGHSGRC